MNAPHLPSPSCSVPLRRRLERVPFIVLYTFLAILASATVSLFVVSKFSFSPTSETRVVVAGSATKENVTLNPLVLRDVKEKTVTLIDTTKKSYDGYLYSAFLGQAAILSTDGWVVTTAVLPSNLASVSAVDAQGVLHSISAQRIDTTTGLRYLKISGDGFRIFDISSDIPSEKETMPVFSFNEQGVFSLLVSHPEPVDKSSLIISQSSLALSIDPVVSQSYVVVNDRGALIGLINRDGSFVPGFVVRYGLTFVLSNKSVVLKTLPYTFAPIRAIVRDGQLVQTRGFVVTRIQPKKADEILKVGDIITRIDNVSVRESVLYTLLFDSREQVTFTVLRDNVEVDLVVPLK